jgi:hypothetical protein
MTGTCGRWAPEVTGRDGRRVGSDVFDGSARELRELVIDRRP